MPTLHTAPLQGVADLVDQLLHREDTFEVTLQQVLSVWLEVDVKRIRVDRDALTVTLVVHVPRKSDTTVVRAAFNPPYCQVRRVARNRWTVALEFPR